jgi:hypothetical protein
LPLLTAQQPDVVATKVDSIQNWSNVQSSDGLQLLLDSKLHVGDFIQAVIRNAGPTDHVLVLTDHVAEPAEVVLPADLFRGFHPSFEFDSEPKDDDQVTVMPDTSAVAQEGDCILLPNSHAESVYCPLMDLVLPVDLASTSMIHADSSEVHAASRKFPLLDILAFIVPDEPTSTLPLLTEPASRFPLLDDSVSTILLDEPASHNSAVVKQISTLVKTKKKPSSFLPLDPEVFEKVCNMEESKSIKNERWAQNRFNSWRESVGLNTAVSIVELPLEDFADLLTCFFLCLCKDLGERYPSGSIGNMYDSFHRIIARHQAKVMKMEKRKEPLIRISDHQFFFQTNSAVVKAMEMSRDAGANKPRVKPKCLTFSEEALILKHHSTQLNCPKGLLKRMLYYCVTFFVIRGNKECYNLKYRDFTIGVNQAGARFVK